MEGLMNNIEEIAVSRIADILASTKLVRPEIDIWKKIYNNAGLAELYETKAPQLTTEIYKYGHGLYEKNLYHNERCYNGLIESFKYLECKKGALIKLFNSIAEKISIVSIFTEDVERKIKKETSRIKNMDIEEYIMKVDISERNIILNKYIDKNFNSLRNNFNLLSLDIFFNENGLCVLPFTGGITESEHGNTAVKQWLSLKYPNIFASYTDAIKAYSTDDDSGCIMHCRNVITGIFSHKKDERTKWIDGLRKACQKDKNIMEVMPNEIAQKNYNIHSCDEDERYKYPRFNLIYKLYSFTCALGSHITEGNIVNSTVKHEEVTIEDAYMALKMTEAVLIWIYQTNAL